MMRVVLFDLGDGRPQRVLVVVHHLVCDNASLRIVLEDVSMAYEQLAAGTVPYLDASAAALSKWIEHLHSLANGAAGDDAVARWTSDEYMRVRPLPRDLRSEPQMPSVESIRFDERQTSALLFAARGRRFDMKDVLLAAAVMSICEWSERSAVLVSVDVHGRDASAELSRVVGWLSTQFPVLVESARTLDETVAGIQRGRAALPAAGVSYGAVRYLSDDPETRELLARAPSPEVAFNHLGAFVPPRSDRFRLRRQRPGVAVSARARRAYDERAGLVFDVTTSIDAGELCLAWEFHENMHTRDTARGLLRRMVDVLGMLARAGTA
jgi:non-ribosomal peptide synthase protein (TIGR01720 family)